MKTMKAAAIIYFGKSREVKLEDVRFLDCAKMPVLRFKSPYSIAVSISKVPKESDSFLIGDDAAAVSACLDRSLGGSNRFVQTATEKTGTAASFFDLVSS